MEQPEQPSREGRIQSLLNFLALPKASKPLSPDDPLEIRTIVGMERIVSLIDTAVIYQNPVNVIIGGERQPFFTYFTMESPADLEAMRQGEYLLAAPLDPPLGNMKIRIRPNVKLHFFSDLHVIEVQVTFQKFLEDKTIKFSFPQEAVRNAQKRAHPRFNVDPFCEGIHLTVIRPSGVSFEAKVFDISLGGMAFYAIDPVASMSETAKVGLIISRPGALAIEMSALVLGAMNKNGHKCYRANFQIKSHVNLEEIKKLIRYIQEQHVNRRQMMFHG